MTINWKKILGVVLGLVVLVGVSYLVLWLKKDMEPGGVRPAVQNGTSTVAGDILGWKTYRNKRYGFKFEYLTSWVGGEASSYGLFRLEKWFHPERFGQPPGDMSGFCSLEFFVLEKESIESIDKWLWKLRGEENSSPPISSLPITVDSKEGLRETSGEIGLVDSVYVEISQTEVLSMSLLCGEDVREEGTKEFNQTLSTFKFIEPATSTVDAEWEIKSQQAQQDSKSWPTYTNSNLGFSMKYPRKAGNGEIIFIRAGNVVFVTTKTSDLFKQQQLLPQSDEEYILRKAKDINNSSYRTWAIIIRSINSDAELNRFIKDEYGDGCKLGEKKPSSQQGVYNVGIDQVVPGDMETGSCFLNWVIGFKYSPEKHKAAIWDMGQDYYFVLENGYPADGFMEDSFTFSQQ